MAYANLHDRLLDNEWYMKLPDSLARTWVHLIAYAAKEDGEILSTDIDFIASKIGRKPSSLRMLLDKSEGRIFSDGNSLKIRDWRQWNKERDSSKDRVRAYRNRKRVTGALRNGDVTHSLREEEDKRREEKSRQDRGNLKSSQPDSRVVNPSLKLELNKIAEQFKPNGSGPEPPAGTRPIVDMAALIEVYETLRAGNPQWRPAEELRTRQKERIATVIAQHRVKRQDGQERSFTVEEIMSEIERSEYLPKIQFGLGWLADPGKFAALMAGEYAELFKRNLEPGIEFTKPKLECELCHLEFDDQNEYLRHMHSCCA